MFFVKILVLKYIFYIIKQIYARTWTGAILMEAKWKFLLVGSLEKIEIWNIDNPYLSNHLETKKLRLFLIKSVLSIVWRVFDNTNFNVGNFRFASLGCIKLKAAK